MPVRAERIKWAYSERLNMASNELQWTSLSSCIKTVKRKSEQIALTSLLILKAVPARVDVLKCHNVCTAIPLKSLDSWTWIKNQSCDLLTSGQMHAYSLPWTISQLVLTAQTINVKTLLHLLFVMLFKTSFYLLMLFHYRPLVQLLLKIVF